MIGSKRKRSVKSNLLRKSKKVAESEIRYSLRWEKLGNGRAEGPGVGVALDLEEELLVLGVDARLGLLGAQLAVRRGIPADLLQT